MPDKPTATAPWPIFLRYFHTLRFLRPAQLVYRLLFEVKFRFYRRAPALWERFYGRHFDYPAAKSTLDRAVILKGLEAGRKGFLLGRAEILGRAHRLLGGEFSFLNHTRRFSGRVEWDNRSVSHLWRYQLHYFDYTWDLGVAYWASGDSAYYRKFKELVLDWIEENPLGHSDGWHPYTISRRVVNWIYARAFFASRLVEDAQFHRRLLQSLHIQCAFLARNLEFHSGGNHLLANIRALLFGGVCLGGRRAEQWIRRGLWLLHRELDEQVLADGGHFERSPMYHLIAMKDLIECLVLLIDNGITVRPEWREKLRAMAEFAEALLMPDGQMPLINDSARDLMPDPHELIGTAKELGGAAVLFDRRVFSYLLLGSGQAAVPQSPEEPATRSVALPDSGYFVLRSGGNSTLIIDGGPIGPDYLPAHAHADTLSFDFWLEGVAFIADSGVYEYAPGPWRDFFRSTRAHNTVVVDGKDQSEVWGSFRVARRARPRDIIWITSDTVDYFSGGHDGYGRLPEPVLHHRKILSVRDDFWLIADLLTGRGRHRADNYIHFHPEVEVLRESPGKWRATRQGRTLTLCSFGSDGSDRCAGQLDPPQGWYSPEFGVREPRPSLSWHSEGSLPLLTGYIMVPDQVGRVEAACDLAEPERYEVVIDATRWVVEVSTAESRICVDRTDAGGLG